MPRVGSRVSLCNSAPSSRRAGDSISPASTHPTTGQRCNASRGRPRTSASSQFGSTTTSTRCPNPPRNPPTRRGRSWRPCAVSPSASGSGRCAPATAISSPPYLAKVASSIDAISGGQRRDGHRWRLVRARVPRLRLSVSQAVRPRLGELDEAVQIMNLMWSEDEASFEGVALLHRRGDLPAEARPGSGGIPMLDRRWGRAAHAAHRRQVRRATPTSVARSTSSPTSLTGVSPAIASKDRQGLRRTSRDQCQLQRVHRMPTLLRSQAKIAAAAARSRGNRARTMAAPRPTALLNGPGMAVGTPDQIVDALRSFEAAGMTYAIVYFTDAAYDAESMELFASEVMPAFRVAPWP